MRTPAPSTFGRRIAVRFIVVLGIAAAAVSCGSSVRDGGSDSTIVPGTAGLGTLCATMSKAAVPECIAAYADGEPFRLPPDPDTSHVYGGLIDASSRLATRGGPLPIAEAATATLTSATQGGDLSYARTLYLATVADGTVTQLAPVALITDQVLLQRALGGVVFEGTISPLAGPDYYDIGARGLPVRIELAATAAADRIDATIVNATASVAAADGRCLPALSTSDANPLVGSYHADLQFSRVPAMHAPFNDELVIAWRNGPSGMNAELLPTVASVLGLITPVTSGDVFLHGNPTSGPAFKLQTVAGGGGVCPG